MDEVLGLISSLRRFNHLKVSGPDLRMDHEILLFRSLITESTNEDLNSTKLVEEIVVGDPSTKYEKASQKGQGSDHNRKNKTDSKPTSLKEGMVLDPVSPLPKFMFSSMIRLGCLKW
ncbi:hypothetical protein E3N88_21803 [Mikania micrantha]|uniref:Uncharacterized protein n=1 Tax=Mikania micrantha TaxID=192012 RepID=A0A5N6N8K7_9ASTR|nr:hypothetical protein E3N88_21803 [Mikania micrantha]